MKLSDKCNSLCQLITRNIKITPARKTGRIIGAAVAVFILIFVIAQRNLFLDPELELTYGVLLFVIALLTAPACGLLIGLKAKVSDHFHKICFLIWFLLLPIASMQMVEAFDEKFIWNFSIPTFFMNYMIYLCLYLLLYVITNRLHLTTLIVNIFLLVWSLVNYFVTLFRGTPFVPMDILSISTGLSVADGYTYELSWQLIMGCILFLMIYLLNRQLKNLIFVKLRAKILARVVPAGVLCALFLPFFFTELPAKAGYKPDFWNQARGYHKTGSFFNFCLNTKYLHVSKPSGYDAENTGEILAEYLEESGTSIDSETSINILTGENDYVATVTDTSEMPNIICIMNESFSDLSMLGDLETNTEYLEFYNSLTENTIKGTLYVPVFGAGTSNSEFEFLTGNSLSSLPAGCNVFQSYIKSNQSSLVSTLEALGYSSQAFHPYYKDGWNRTSVYELLGFNSFTAIEDFIDNDILDTYQSNNDAEEYIDLIDDAYPDDDILLRRFVSDSYDYEMVIEMFENRDESQPFFLFNVTMQNHGGYAASYSNFLQEVYITNMDGYYPQANRYLSLIKASDEAFEELIEYFSDVDEPTIILMFGDHQPSIETAFYEELLGSDLDDLSGIDELSRYVTPFIIWANYDIEEAEVEMMSANYLSTLLLQTAGLELTDYNKFLAAMYQDLPVVTTSGYIDSDLNFYSNDDSSEYDDLLNIYSRIEYNNLLDSDNTDDSLFYVGGYTSEDIEGSSESPYSPDDTSAEVSE